MYNRKKTKEVFVGNVGVGGNHAISIQSMTKTDTRNVASTVAQINELEKEGCEIIRIAVLDMAAADAIYEIKKKINIPLVADIHFDYRLAVRSAEAGADKLRINPGNIGNKERISQVVSTAKKHGIPIRIGVNSGSLEKDILNKHGGVTAGALVESTLRHVNLLEELDFEDIIIAVKSSGVRACIDAYTLLSEKVDYPLHIGVTESGTLTGGSLKSACGISALLTRGIGDTVRVSLSADPIEEVKCAKQILKHLELRRFGPVFISCPTCGRTEVDLLKLAERIENACSGLQKDITVAVMGCVVNGPGEASDADIGIAGGKGCGLIFKKGQIIKKVSEDQLFGEFMSELSKLT